MFTKKTYRCRWPEALLKVSIPRHPNHADPDENGNTWEYYPQVPMYVLQEAALWKNINPNVNGGHKVMTLTMTIQPYGIWCLVKHFYLDKERVVCEVVKNIVEDEELLDTVWIDYSEPEKVMIYYD